MKKIKALLLLALLLIFSCSAFAEVVILHGTSSSGKSTYSKNLSQNSSEWTLTSLDEWMEKTTIDFLKIRYPEEFQKVEQTIDPSNLYHSLMHPPLYKKGISQEAIDQANAALLFLKQKRRAHYPAIFDQTRETLLAYSQEQSNEGKKVLVDTVLVDMEQYQEYRKILKNAPLVLAYLPVDQLIERVIQRNESAYQSNNLTNLRSPLCVIRQFCQLYRPVKHDQEVVVGKISRWQLQEAVRKAYYAEKKEQAEPLDWVEVEALMSFGLFDHDEAFITSVIPFDFIQRMDISPLC